MFILSRIGVDAKPTRLGSFTFHGFMRLYLLFIVSLGCLASIPV